MEKLKGYVERVIYRSDESGYTVLSLLADGDERVCTGVLPMLSEGELIEVEGVCTVHPSYGEQIRIGTYRILPPEDDLAIERYLASGAIKGIGSALAGRIVCRFHADTFRVMEEEPELLVQIRGISERKAREIAAQVEEKRDMRQAFLFLADFGISNALAARIYSRYGGTLYGIMRTNPYKLADDIKGVGFKIADQIARKAGIAVDSDFRIRSGIVYALTQSIGEGHMFLPADELRERTEQLLQIRIEDFDRYVSDLLVDRKLIRKEDHIYLLSLYYRELNTARMLCDLRVDFKIPEEKALRRIVRIEKEQGITLDEQQRLAVLTAVRSGVMVLTGGPGTGKTTTINTILAYFEEEGKTIALAAPTGRAAKRMTETTGREARTIHRLLEVEGSVEDEPDSFGRDSGNPLETDVLVVDEMSMVDIHLMHALLSALVPGTRLILVGDANQLPSVGPGCVLRDIIRSETVRVVRLEHIFRQALQSDIVVNAHKINRGEHIRPDNKSSDFFFLERYEADRIIRHTIDLIRNRLPAYVKAPWQELQVLTPTRKGLLGVERLNRILQSQLNPAAPGKAECRYGDLLFRRGDKVMQIRNNYQLEWEVRGRYGFAVSRGEGVFNGDIGTVMEIDPVGETVEVLFDEDRTVTYPYQGLDELELAYALTIHKSQGSEYPAVIMPLLDGPRMLMNRNLLYTGVTRARNCVVILGDPAVMSRMIDNTQEQQRNTSLQQRLREMAALADA